MRELLFSSATEASRLPDEQMGDAYESTTPDRRAWIKSTLALVQAHHSVPPFREERYVENPAAGFSFVSHTCAAPWTVLLLGRECASPVRLAAAIMTARLAGIEDILAVCTNELRDPALLATLELTGVEHVFALPVERVVPFLNELVSFFGSENIQGTGRLLSFGVTQLDMICQVLPKLVVWKDRTPLVGVFPDAENMLDCIRQAHPDAVPLLLNTIREEDKKAFDVVYGTGTVEASLHLAPNLAGAWICPDLKPTFFLNSELSVSSIS